MKAVVENEQYPLHETKGPVLMSADKAVCAIGFHGKT